MLEKFIELDGMLQIGIIIFILFAAFLLRTTYKRLVKHNGGQPGVDGKIKFHLYTNNETGSTFTSGRIIRGELMKDRENFGKSKINKPLVFLICFVIFVGCFWIGMVN